MAGNQVRDLAEAVRTLLRPLLGTLEEPDDVRRLLEELKDVLDDELVRLVPDEPASDEGGDDEADERDADRRRARDEAEAQAADLHVERRRLRLGGKEAVVPVRVVDDEPADARPTPRPPTPPDVEVRRVLDPSAPRGLALAARRARLKSRAWTWRRAKTGGSDGAGKGNDDRDALLRRARGLPRCELAALDEDRTPVTGTAELDALAGVYANVAHGLELAARWDGPRAASAPEELLQLVAEAQSALLAALERHGLGSDPDQVVAYRWVRDVCKDRGVYVARHLRLEDPADPLAWGDLAARLDDLAARLAAEAEEERERRALAVELAARAERLGDAAPDEVEATWTSICTTLERWVDGGRPPSAHEVCDPLVERLDEIPESVDVPRSAELVLREVDKLRAARERSSRLADAAEGAAPSDEVRRARELLAGRVVVLVGGEVRRQSKDRLEQELGLRELRWLATRPHRPLTPLVTQIERPEVDLVLIAIRWSDHAFEDLRAACERTSKPFVRLPAGYGVNRVAHDVLEQASGRLAGS